MRHKSQLCFMLFSFLVNRVQLSWSNRVSCLHMKSSPCSTRVSVKKYDCNSCHSFHTGLLSQDGKQKSGTMIAANLREDIIHYHKQQRQKLCTTFSIVPVCIYMFSVFLFFYFSNCMSALYALSPPSKFRLIKF